MSPGRELPHQIELKDMNRLKDRWRGNERFVIRQNEDYYFKKLKQEGIDRRMKEIHLKHQNGVNRNEICDEKYFKMIRNEEPFVFAGGKEKNEEEEE